MPLRWLIFSFASGTAWLQQQASLPDLRWLWWWLPILVALLVWPRAGRRGGAGPVGVSSLLAHGLLFTVVAFVSGFFYAAWRADLRLADRLPAAWDGRDIQISGRVTGLPEATPRGWRLVLAVQRVDTPGAVLPERVMLNLFDFGSSAPPGRSAGMTGRVPRGGDCLAVTVRLSPPHGNINPDGFDYEGWLLERGIRARGYIRGQPAWEGEGGCGFSPAAWLDRQREAIRGRLHAALAGRPYAGVVVALAVGDQNAISDAQWTLFRTTGVTHLMSISGLHVTLLASLVFALSQWLWRRSARLTLWVPARRAAALFGLATAAAYVALAGFGLPAQRTLYMVSGMAVALWLSQGVSASRLLAAALAAVVLVDPWAALAPGFWLSFGAVAVLLYAGAGRLQRPPTWRLWLQAQWAVTLALAPVLLLIFHEVSLVSPLANAFAIPAISLLAVPLVLAAALLPIDAVAIVLAQLGHGVIAATLAGLEGLAALPQPVWHAATPTWPALLLAGVGVALLLLPAGFPGRWLGLVLFLPLLLPRLERPADGEFWLDILDVGQGLAVVVRTAGHSLVYDSGPAYASGEDAGRRVVAPYLFGRGIDRLDGLVVSHPDSDHHGGTGSLLASHRPGRRLASMALPGGVPCTAGQRWTWDGVRFEVLHPSARLYAHGGFSENDLSCVLRIVGAGGSALLAGDIERLGELSLLERPQELAADLLVVPHHGSRSSSMAGFVTAVKPRWALFSVGRRNRFGHPDPTVLARFRAAGAELRRTDRDGALLARVGRQGIAVEGARSRFRRYWHGSGNEG